MVKRHATPLDPSAALPAWWEPLHLASGTSIYLSPSWMQTWLEIYGAHFTGEWLRWEADGQVVGGCLLVRGVVRRRGIAFRTLFINATGEAAERTPFAEYNSVACVAGHEESVLADLLAFLGREAWDAIHLSGYVEGSLLGKLAAGLPTAMVRTDPRPSPFADLTALSSSSLEAALSRNARAQIRRCRSLYEEQLGPVELAAAGSVEEALDWFERLTALHTARWQSRGLPGSFGTQSSREFHQRLIRRLHPARQADLLRLRAGATEIGYLYNYMEGGKVYAFQSGFAYEADAKIKPGLLTHMLAVEHYARAGAHEYDFLSGDARYKRTLAKSERILHWTVAYRDRAWIRLLAWLWKLRARSQPAAATQEAQEGG